MFQDTQRKIYVALERLNKNPDDYVAFLFNSRPYIINKHTQKAMYLDKLLKNIA